MSTSGMLLMVLAVVVTCWAIAAIIIIGFREKLINRGDRQIHPEKAVIYKRFIDVWYEQKLQDEASKSELSKSMVLWASDEVLRQYMLLQEQNLTDSIQKPDVSQLVERVILEMRKDLGQKNFGISLGQINQMLTH